MKTQKLWLPMIILGIIGGAAKIGDTVFNINGNGFFLSSDVCSLIFIATLILLFIIGFAMTVSDRKLGIEGKPSKCVPAGIFGFLAAVGLFGSGVISLLSLGSSDSLAASFFMCAISLFAGIIMLYESCILFTGHNGLTKHPLATLALPLWACGRLIVLFIEYSKVSIRATEMFDVISAAFLLLFLFYQSMYFAELNPKLSIRRATLYGILFFICALITTADILIKMIFPAPQIAGIDSQVIQPTISRVLSCITDIAFIGYSLFFVISMDKNAKISDEPEDTEDDDSEFLGRILTSSDESPEELSPEKLFDKQHAPSVFTGAKLRFDDGNTDKPDEEIPVKAELYEMEDTGSYPSAAEESFEVNHTDETETAPALEEINEPTGEPAAVFTNENTEPSVGQITEQPTDAAPDSSSPALEPVSEPQTIFEEETPAAYAETEPVTAEKIVPPTAEPAMEEYAADDDLYDDLLSSADDPFDDDKSDADYEEIFRMLDEMTTDD